MKKYPDWIDEYAKSFHNSFSNMVPITWGPTDAVELIGKFNGLYLSKIYNAITEIKKQNIPMDKVAKSFSGPSILRLIMYWVVSEYVPNKQKNKEQFRKTMEFLVEVLRHMVKKDIFAYESNIAHSVDEVNNILNTTKWSEGDKFSARELGKLYNSLASLVFALYRDYFPQDSHEVYGPYDASKKFGKDTILLIKHFPKIKCVELWPEMKKLKYRDVKIFQVFKDVKFKCELIGMHSIYEGDLINGLISYAVIVDGEYVNDIEQIKVLSDYFAEIATKQSTVYDRLSKEELKEKILYWLCYQAIDFFKLAGIDWKPTGEMILAIKDIDVADRYEMEYCPSFEEYTTSQEFEIYWLKDLYI